MKFGLYAFILFLFIATQAPVKAENLILGISTGYPPYYYKKNDKLTGLCIEMIDAVARKTGLSIQYKEYPWKRLILAAQKGSVDAIMPLFKTSERESYLYFNGLGLAYETNHLFTANDFLISYTGSLDKLSGYRIGVVTDYSYGDQFDTYSFPNKVVTLNDKHLIEMFEHRRFDIGVGNKYIVYYYANLAGIAEQVKFLDPPLSRELLYLGFTKKGKNYDLAVSFAKALQAYKTTREYHLLTQKYGMANKQ